MLSDRFGADHFVQVVLHDGVAQSGRNVCLWNAFGSGRSNGSFNEYRTALAQCGRALCGQRQLAKFSQGDTHTGGLFLYKRTGARCADLVHLEIHDLTVFQADVFAVLPADLKDSIHLRHPVRSALCLRGDLIPHGIGTDALADTLPPGASHAHRRKAHRTEPFPDAGQPLADSSFRVACGAQILEIHQFTLRPHQNKVGAGGTDVDAQRTALLRRIPVAFGSERSVPGNSSSLGSPVVVERVAIASFNNASSCASVNAPSALHAAPMAASKRASSGTISSSSVRSNTSRIARITPELQVTPPQNTTGLQTGSRRTMVAL